MADEKREQLLQKLTHAYWSEIETVMNYLAASVNLDGIRAREIAESLSTDIEEELGHAKTLGGRIKELYGVVPGSVQFSAEQKYLQPPEHQTDVIHVIKGVITAERDAIQMYQDIVDFTDDFDLVTQGIVLDILHDEQGHLRLFEGFLREYEAEGRA